MRFTEFNPTINEQILDEVDMSPSSLRKLAAQTGAQAGMEFEMIVPGVGDTENDDMEADYSEDRRTRSIQDVIDFFSGGDGINDRRELRDLERSLQDSFRESIDAEWYSVGENLLREYIEENEWDFSAALEDALNEMGLTEEEVAAAIEAGSSAAGVTSAKDLPKTEAFSNYREAESAAESELEDMVDREWLRQGRIYDELYNDFVDNFSDRDWIRDTYSNMSDIENSFDIRWPYYASSDEATASVDEIADDFSKMIGKPVNASSSYHGARREAGHYVVEPDSSLEPDDGGDSGLEFVSPPMPVDDLISDLNKVKQWANRMGCYTNESTGLHINVSVPAMKNSDSLDYVKLALLLGDNYVLKQFDRQGNTYCKSVLDSIRFSALKLRADDPTIAASVMEKMKAGLAKIAAQSIHSGFTQKYTSINNKNGYIEFRSPGGDWLDDNFAKIENTLLRMVVALDAACDPEKYKNEYLTKLYKLFDIKNSDDPLRYFALYSAGNLPKAALKSFIKQIRLNRDVKKAAGARRVPALTGPEPAPNNSGEYELYVMGSAPQNMNPGSVIMRFNADNDRNARELAINYASNQGIDASYLNIRRSQVVQQSWNIINAAGTLVHDGIRANTQAGADEMARRWLLNLNPAINTNEFRVVPAT